jgi:hypothetical protein
MNELDFVLLAEEIGVAPRRAADRHRAGGRALPARLRHATLAAEWLRR